MKVLKFVVAMTLSFSAVMPVLAVEGIQRNPYEINFSANSVQNENRCGLNENSDDLAIENIVFIEKESNWSSPAMIVAILAAVAQFCIAGIAVWAILRSKTQSEETLNSALKGTEEVIESGINKFTEVVEEILISHGVFGQMEKSERDLPSEFDDLVDDALQDVHGDVDSKRIETKEDNSANS